MKTLVLEIDGQEQTAFVEKIKGRLWVHLNGKTLTYKPEEESFDTSSGANVADPRFITAPMPGKIIKIVRQEGEELSEGETIVVMEAMKMEYTLTTAASVKVEKINCKEGQQVGLGDKLVEMEVLND